MITFLTILLFSTCEKKYTNIAALLAFVIILLVNR